jgi:hypothetical protein
MPFFFLSATHCLPPERVVGFVMPERTPMQIIRDLPSTLQISDPAIRKLVQQRIDDLGGDKFNATELGYFLVIEPGDSLDSISAQMGFPVLANRCTGIKFGEPGFAPSFEFVEEIGNCYDTVFIVDDIQLWA